MDIRQLRYFLAVAEHRHFTRAARASFVSQPALSQQIRSLERELGTPLFDRLSGGAELTTAGEALRPYAARILRDLENAKVAVEEATGAIRGELSVSAVHTANLTIVVDVLRRFRERYPAVRVRVHEERSSEVVESVLSGRVNVGVSYLPVASESLLAVPLYEEELLLVMPAAHPLAGRQVAPTELAGQPLIVPPDGFCLREGVERALREAGAEARVVAEISAPESICEAVRASLGLTLLPRSYMERRGAADGLSTARLGPPVPVRTVAVLRRTDRHLCLATRAFLGALDGVAKTAA